jgi:hypothetical protein
MDCPYYIYLNKDYESLRCELENFTNIKENLVDSFTMGQNYTRKIFDKDDINFVVDYFKKLNLYKHISFYEITLATSSHRVAHKDYYPGHKYKWSLNIPFANFENSATCFWETKGPPNHKFQAWKLTDCNLLSKKITKGMYLMDTTIAHSVEVPSELTGTRKTLLVRLDTDFDPEIWLSNNL